VAYYIDSGLHALEAMPVDELLLARVLEQMPLVFSKNTNTEFRDAVFEISSLSSGYKKLILELEMAEKRVVSIQTKKTKDEIQTHDLKTIKNIGIFYVLEYTLTVEQEMNKLSNDKQLELLNRGLNLSVGNLPALFPLMKSFRHELAYNIFNKRLRDRVLKVFFVCEDRFSGNKLVDIREALHTMNLELLRIVLNGGLIVFTGTVYKPYPDNTSIQSIIDSYESRI